MAFTKGPLLKRPLLAWLNGNWFGRVSFSAALGNLYLVAQKAIERR